VQWLRATAEVTQRLLSGDPRGEVLDLVTLQALEISGADLVVLALPASDRKQLVIEHACGDGAAGALGLVLPAEGSASGTVMASGKPLAIDDFSGDPRVARVARDHMRLGPAVLVPLGARILAIMEEMTGSLGHPPGLRMAGQLDTRVPGPIAEHMLAALREALANVAKHAHATRIDVIVEAGSDLVLRVRTTVWACRRRRAAAGSATSRTGPASFTGRSTWASPKAAAPSWNGAPRCRRPAIPTRLAPDRPEIFGRLSQGSWRPRFESSSRTLAA